MYACSYGAINGSRRSLTQNKFRITQLLEFNFWNQELTVVLEGVVPTQYLHSVEVNSFHKKKKNYREVSKKNVYDRVTCLPNNKNTEDRIVSMSILFLLFRKVVSKFRRELCKIRICRYWS